MDVSTTERKHPRYIGSPRWVVSIGKRIDGERVIEHRLKFYREDFAHKMRDALAKSWEIAEIHDESQQEKTAA